MNASHRPVLDLHPRHGIHAPTVATPAGNPLPMSESQI